MSLAIFVSPKWSFQDDNGGNASGWMLYTYEPGTSTPKAAYQDSAGTTPHANPIVLDARGEAEIWLDGAYKFVLKNAAGVTKWTADDITGYGSGVQTGYLTKSVAGSANVSLTASEQSNAVIEFTGELTGNINVTVGDDKDGYRWTLVNNTTGGFTLTFKTTSGTGAAIDQGAEAVVYHDGTNIVHDQAGQRAGLGLGSAATRDAAGAGDVYARGGILGTVSQSGGIPTGAIIERGSNANGEYVRFADGTQICTSGLITYATPIDFTTTSGHGFYVAALGLWTYPSAFVASPDVGPKSRDGRFLTVSLASLSPIGATPLGFRATSATALANTGYELIAIGRWY